MWHFGLSCTNSAKILYLYNWVNLVRKLILFLLLVFLPCSNLSHTLVLLFLLCIYFSQFGRRSGWLVYLPRMTRCHVHQGHSSWVLAECCSNPGGGSSIHCHQYDDCLHELLLRSPAELNHIREKEQARSQGGPPGPLPQAIQGQGIVNALFWLYCGFNFSESKIILIHKAVYTKNTPNSLFHFLKSFWRWSLLPEARFLAWMHAPNTVLFCFLSLYFIILLNTSGWGNRVPNLPFL